MNISTYQHVRMQVAPEGGALECGSLVQGESLAMLSGEVAIEGPAKVENHLVGEHLSNHSMCCDVGVPSNSCARQPAVHKVQLASFFCTTVFTC